MDDSNHRYDGVFPARAGMSAAEAISMSFGTCVPRPRGDEPQGSGTVGLCRGERRSRVRGGYRSSASPGARGSSPGAASHNVRMGAA